MVAYDGSPLGVMPVADALRTASDQRLDLVEVEPRATPPVCRLMDYLRWKYEAAQKAKG